MPDLETATSTETLNQTAPANPEPSQMPLPFVETPDASETSARKQELKQMLAQTRQTREMLTDFQVAIQNGSYNGHQSTAIAIGLQFLASMLKQNKNDIERLQNEAK
jgi:hypothetical protein